VDPEVCCLASQLGHALLRLRWLIVLVSGRFIGVGDRLEFYSPGKAACHLGFAASGRFPRLARRGEGCSPSHHRVGWVSRVDRGGIGLVGASRIGLNHLHGIT
jgi:hypothetical protein